MPLHANTPLVHSDPLSALAGRDVWLKLDALQPPGSFKIRGIGHACEVHRTRGATRFVSSSGGNAGLAVAYAGRHMAIPVTVVVPETTTPRAIALLRQQGAEVRVHGASWQEANEVAQSLIGPTDAFIHPFDDPLVWTGHATLVDEVVQAGLTPDAVVCCVGGGGLLCGIAEGLQRNALGTVPIIAVETHGAASLHDAIQAGHPVTLERIATIATSLGARRVADRAFAWTQERPVESVLVSDASAVHACERFLDDHRILVEPACGASLAPVYEQSAMLEPYRTILVVVCGGATATAEQLRHWSATIAS